MNGQMTIPCKHGITGSTFVRFLSCVSTHVPFQVTPNSKPGTACVTCIRCLPIMNARMFIHVTTLSKRGTTCVTLSFLFSVSTDIPFQIIPSSKLGTSCVTVYGVIIFLFSVMKTIMVVQTNLTPNYAKQVSCV